MLLFVCGFPSGGTDLVKTVLNAHPDIYLNGEMPFLKNIIQYGYNCKTKFAQVEEIRAFQYILKKLNTWNNIENVRHDFSLELASGELTLSEVLKTCFLDRTRLVWGNKTPQNTESIGPLYTLFPEAYFLIVVRDVRDVCLSWQDKWGKDKYHCAAKWAIRMQQGWDFTREMPAKHYLFIKFEDLLSETERCCRQMCAFLDIPFSDRMLEHHKYVESPLDGKINYGQAIIPDNIKKWEHRWPHKTVKRIEEIAFDTMNLFDYPIMYATEAKLLSSLEMVRGRWNDAWALLSVGNRASRKNSFLHRLSSVKLELQKRFLR